MAAESPSRGRDATLVERLLDQQRDCWRRGERVLVEALVERHPALVDDREKLLDLIWNEVDLRASGGDKPRLEEYLQRFPHLSDDLSRQFEVFAALGSAVHALESKDRRADVTVGPESAPPAGETPDPWLEKGYEILEKLGQGGMGVVYKARCLKLGRVVALKMVLAGAHAGPEDLLRFLREAEATAGLQHPHIVQVHEIGRHVDLPYLTLEYVAGGSLATKLAHQPQPPAEAARLVELLARAVQHAHRAGVVHRDLKPANVLLTEAGEPKVTDFGLAKRVEGGAGLTASGAIVGTPSYMAPEQALAGKRPVGPPADVYALGAILYECLTGRPPFQAPDVMDVLLQVLDRDPVPPGQLQPTTPRDLETICLKCLQKDPEKRYGGAEALAEDLRRYREGEPIAARPAGRLERAWRWCRRKPKDAALVAAGLLAVVLGPLVFLWIRQAIIADYRTKIERKYRDINLQDVGHPKDRDVIPKNPDRLRDDSPNSPPE